MTRKLEILYKDVWGGGNSIPGNGNVIFEYFPAQISHVLILVCNKGAQTKIQYVYRSVAQGENSCYSSFSLSVSCCGGKRLNNQTLCFQ